MEKSCKNGIETQEYCLWNENCDYLCSAKNKKREKIMATAIKAIPTLEGKEAEEFLRRAEEAEKNYIIESEYEHPFCVMAHEILAKAGMA